VFQYLTAKFGSNGTRGTGNQDSTPVKRRPNRLQIDLDGITAKKVFQINIAKVAYAHAICDDISQSWNCAKFHPAALADFYESLHLGRVGRWHCNQDFINGVGINHISESVYGSEYGQAFNLKIGF
jgi:hypothetical protein